MRLAVTLALSSAACATPMYHRYTPPVTNLTASVDAATVLDVVNEFAVMMPGFDPWGLRIVIDNDARDARCGGLHDGCTHFSSYGHTVIYVPWRGDLGRDVAAELLVHELCHVYYKQTTGDADMHHTHHECFARRGGQYAVYLGETGIADDVSRRFF